MFIILGSNTPRRGDDVSIFSLLYTFLESNMSFEIETEIEDEIQLEFLYRAV